MQEYDLSGFEEKSREENKRLLLLFNYIINEVEKIRNISFKIEGRKITKSDQAASLSESCDHIMRLFESIDFTEEADMAKFWDSFKEFYKNVNKSEERDKIKYLVDRLTDLRASVETAWIKKQRYTESGLEELERENYRKILVLFMSIIDVVKRIKDRLQRISQEEMMKYGVVFRVQLTIAWPIWAGGYPTQEEALQVLNQQRDTFVALLEERLQLLLGNGFSLSNFVCQIGAYVPISSLFPAYYVPNSISLLLEVSAQYSSLMESNNSSSKITDAVEDLAGLIKTFSMTHMPGASDGANLYDVSSRWDPGPALLHTESDEIEEVIKLPQQGQLDVSRKSSTKRTRVFICYSHRDSKWLTRLQVHLAPLMNRLAGYYGIDVWDDTKIKSGMKWRDEIRNAIQTARVAILLISADFIASDFIRSNELPPLLTAARSEGVLILPVILGPSAFTETPVLQEYQSVNDPSRPLVSLSRAKQEKVLDDIRRAVMQCLEK
jgi:hypothetical protein